MKTSLLILVLAAGAPAQEPRVMMDRLGAGGPVGVGEMMGGPIKGAPYSATIVTETVQTLADGNRIVQRSEGKVARDSQGRMRHEAVLPVIATMAAATPRIVFILDPVAGTSYTLNPAEKTFRQMPGPSQAAKEKVRVRLAAPPPGAQYVETGQMPTGLRSSPQADVRTESLGSRLIEGVACEGTRSTRTIPAGEVGNEKPIVVLSEVWTSTELRTVVSSRRVDPRTGEMSYSLKTISRTEPDASLFAVPSGFKQTDAGSAVINLRPKDNE